MKGQRATLEHLPKVYNLTIEFATEQGWHYNSSEVVKFLCGHLNNPNSFINIVVLDDDIVGIFVAFLDRNAFTGELFGHDQFIYVVPEYRNSEVAICLYREFQDWAKLHGCRETIWCIYGRETKDRMLQVLEHMGHEKIGYIVKETL